MNILRAVVEKIVDFWVRYSSMNLRNLNGLLLYIRKCLKGLKVSCFCHEVVEDSILFVLHDLSR